ncbi:NUDIX hydrolase [Lentibacillus amyloliquefaciens]|uniref:ADP-ribose pyrophosphatase n=1 Tax=Lentibacillus amyloliquefaciens TaxID=1472767 RepID=A0A0U4FBZ9_9BACI|nr:NUDIX hydrolase [Lentibacillus amyloliquefaciens]ALX48013.1 ADP-ribose pyrophosphatase [Lentibacillus amyloliquefaciens]
MKKFEEKTTHTEKIYDGKVVKLQVDDVLLPDGNTSRRELIKHSGAVGVIPITKDNKIVFVEQYRKPLEKTLVEIPAGKLEKEEEPAVTARRELEEETGYTVTEPMEFVTSFYTSPGFADEIMYLYIAKTLEPVENPAGGDDDEFIELIELTLEEAKQYAADKRIHDAKTNYAILYLETLERM